MAAADYAILVGISRYRDSEQFPTLNGPLNDVKRVREWLVDKELGEGVPGDNVLTLMTSEQLLSLPPKDWPKDTVWAPNREEFSRLFTNIAFDEEGQAVRREGRLYLYFSGHGFSLNEDNNTSAALFSADNYGNVHSNLAGTVYAAATKRARFFKEVVLIMDCCRDVLGNYAYNIPDFNKVENDGSESVRVFSLYAAPRRGKSQERELADSDGKVVGLMTHALLKALEEAPCDVSGRVPGKVLSQYLEFNWQSWYTVKPVPPAPRGVPPDQGDVFFKARQPVKPVQFMLSAGGSVGSQMRLKSDALNAFGQVGEATIKWRDGNYAWVTDIPFRMDAAGAAMGFTLQLLPGKHTFTTGSASIDFDPGVDNAVNL